MRKPAESTLGTSLLFAEAASAASIPDRVFNVVTVPCPEVGERVVTHRGVAMTFFTGSTAVGRRILVLAAGSGKRVHLELGGKAPMILFDDADIEAAAHGAMVGSLINGRQDCTAAMRAYIQRPLFDAFTTRVTGLMDVVLLGDLSLWTPTWAS